MPHVIRKPGVLHGTALAAFLAVVHAVNDTITAMLGALLPTLQARFDVGSTLLAFMVATYSIASSVTQPYFGAVAEERGLRLVGAIGVLFAALFLGLIGVAPMLVIVFALLVIGGMGSAALHPVGTTIAGSPSAPNRTLGVGLFTTGGMVGFALGPVLILHVVSRFGVTATPWLMLPGIALSLLVFMLLPVWEPHRHRPLRDRLGFTQLRGPVGLLALSGSLASVAFLTFTSAVPIWLVSTHGASTDASLIGWTLAVFSLSAGIGSIAGGLLAPRLGRQQILVGSLSLAVIPLVAVLNLEPGSTLFFVSAGLSGLLLYMGSPIKVVVAQDLAPREPASVAGVVLGTSTAIGALIYIGLGQIQDIAGLTTGMAIGFAFVLPAAAIALAVFKRHPEVAQ
jgi:FSR family fosmidomycin resistance protein-like MFS transporter